MKAVIIRQFGGEEVVEYTDVPLPEIKADEVLIKVMAAGVNPVDWKIREGLLKDRMPYEFPITLGWEASGLIEERGPKVTGFKKGDEVFAYARKDKIHEGTYAEYACLEPRHLAPKPKNISFEEAAAIPLAGLTAYQVLFESIQLQPGEIILIHGGAGGVGGFAIQLAKNTGAYVITTARSENHDYVRSLGADEAIDYSKEDFVEILKRKYPQGIDAVLDTIGGKTQKKSADVLKKRGRLTSILALDEAYLKSREIITDYVFVRPEPQHLTYLKELVEQEKLKVYLNKVYPLQEAAKALTEIKSGHTRGKIVLKI